MNDQEPGAHDPGDDDVTALLAEARATGPVPDDVAARLDATLAALTSDRRRVEPVLFGRHAGAPEAVLPESADPEGSPGVVVPLRRRSRTGSRLLAAAAAVLVVGAGGVGISQVLGTNSSDQGVADSASSLAESDDFGAESAPQAPAETGGQFGLPDGPRDEAFSAANPLPRFTTSGFAAEAAAFRYSIALNNLGSAARTPSPSNSDGTTDSDTSGERDEEDLEPSGGGAVEPQDTTTDGITTSVERQRLAYDAAKAACPGPVGIDAVLVPIRYDGEPASLAIYPPTDDRQRYEAWSCDGTTLLASAVVPR